MLILLLPTLVAAQFFGQPQPTTQSSSNYNNNNPWEQGGGGAFGRGIVNQILTPVNNSMNDVGNAVTIQFQLRGYSNPSSALPNGWTCICPPERPCGKFRTAPFCSFGFTFIISTPDQSVRYLATDFIHLEPNGQLPQINGNGKRWDENFVVQLSSKPSAIDVFAHHLGAVLNQADGSLIADDTVTHVDTWVIPLNGVLPAVGGVQSMQNQQNYDGKILGTRLSMSFSIACTGSLIGPNCDLNCSPSPVNTQVAACRSNSTGFFSVCTYQSEGQVDNCKNCPWGIKEGTYCQDEDGGMLDPHTAGVVDTSFKTATIILSIICGILLILFLVALVLACLMRRRQRPVEKEMTTYAKSNGGPSSQPLLHSSFRSDDIPTPIPRSNPPSLDAKPIKSALRKPMIPPNVSNDTRDTSFSNDVPMRPSRSEVV